MLHRCERVTCLVLLTLTSAPSVSDAERIAPLPRPRASYSYDRADQILHWILSGFSADELLSRGFDRDEVMVVRRRLDSTHWKRRLSTVAMLSGTAIGESYLRPVDY